MKTQKQHLRELERKLGKNTIRNMETELSAEAHTYREAKWLDEHLSPSYGTRWPAKIINEKYLKTKS